MVLIPHHIFVAWFELGEESGNEIWPKMCSIKVTSLVFEDTTFAMLTYAKAIDVAQSIVYVLAVHQGCEFRKIMEHDIFKVEEVYGQ